MKQFNKVFLVISMLVMLVMLVNVGWGQSIWTNPITGTNPNASNPYTTGDLKNANITVSGIGRGAGITGTNANDRYNANSWNTASIDLNAYFTFTITPNTNYEIDFVSFVYTSQASGTGPANFAIRSSIDSYASNIGSPSVTGTTISLSAASFQNITNAITFRFYGWNTTNSGGTFSINDFTFNGTVTSTGTTPTIALSPTTLTGFNYVLGNGPSTSKSYNLSGSNLTGFPGNITISGSTNYEVSTDNTNFGSSKTVPYTSATLSSTPIYVRLKAGLIVGNYNGETIGNAGGGAVTQNVTCSGSVTTGANITVSPTSLSGFTYVLGSGPSVSQSFYASGSGLSGDITVTGTTDYEVSLTGSAFFNTVTLTQTSGVVTSTPVYVRLKSGLLVGTYNSENVALSSTGALTQNVSCSGSVVASAQIVYWDGGASTANWNDAANWSNNVVPTTTTEVVLDNTNVSGNYSVNIGATNVAIKKLSITPTSGNTITLTLTSANTGTPGFQIGDNTNGTDDIIIGNGGILINQSGATTASPLALIPETNGGTFRINNGGRYIHNTERRHADLVSALSTVSGTETGIFEFDVPITSNYFVALNGRTFGTLRFRNSTAYNYSASGVTTGPIIRGNLEFENYSGGTGTFSSTEIFSFNVGGNMINNGINISFANQSFNFNGSSSQTISGVGNITFSNMTLNNTYGLTLSRDITVNVLLTLTSGKIVTGSNYLDFSASATDYTEETNSNYILGKARLINKPVGTAALNFLGAYIHSGSDNLGNVSITRITGDHYFFGSNQGINCSWSIVPTTQPTNGRLLDLNWYSAFDNGKNFSSTDKAQVWKSTDNGANWTDIGILVDVSANNPRSITNINTTSFSIWSVSDKDAPLPVTISSLNTKSVGRNVYLNWTTSSESNNSGFDVERAEVSKGSLEFKKLTFINGLGTLNIPTNYTFEDRNLQSGKYKYRLKQVDMNGNFEYFALNGEVEIGVPKKYYLSQNYPNPFNPVTKINYDLPEAGKVDLRIYDMLGKEMAILVNEFRFAGYHTAKFDASKLSSGIYFYRFNSGKFDSIKKMAVIK